MSTPTTQRAGPARTVLQFLQFVQFLQRLLSVPVSPRRDATCGSRPLRTFHYWPALIVLAASVALADPDWPEERIQGPFVYRANFSLAAQTPLLKEIAQLHSEIPQRLQLKQPLEPVHVYLLDDPTTYQAYVRHYFPQAPSRRALFIKDRGPGMVFAYQSREIDVDLRHECTHAVLHAILPMVPLWLDEGLAEYFEVPAPQRYGQNRHLSTVRARLRWKRPTPLVELENLRDVGQMNSDHYRDAWAWVHFLLHGPPEARDELLHYLTDIQSFKPPGRLSDRLSRPLPQVEYDYVRHFRDLQ